MSEPLQHEDHGAWAFYVEPLLARGLSHDDAIVLLRQAQRTEASFVPVAHGFTPLVPFVRDHLDGTSWATLLDALTETQARGPCASAARAVWRVLYLGGCPLDHLWCVFFHAFKDPESDPQDWVTVAPEVALAEANRYVRLRFPRASGPWPGLGCENTIACVRNRIEVFSEAKVLGAFQGVSELMKARQVVSPRLVAEIDAQARLPDDLCAAIAASQGGELAPEIFAWVEARPHAEAFDVARRWVHALDALRQAGSAVHDVGGDRFMLSEEPLEERAPIRRREPEPPVDRREALRAVIAPWEAAYEPPWGKMEGGLEARLDARDYQEPLRWLDGVAELALVEWAEDGTSRVRAS